MIRVNLLRQNIVVSGVSARSLGSLTLPSLTLLSAVLLGMGGWWWTLSAQIDKGQREADSLDREVRRLAEVHKQVTRFEAQKKLLEERITVIERLRKNQTGPVDLLETIIASVPNRPTLWLTNLTQKGNKVTLEGHSFDVPSIADFIASLSQRGTFLTVELAYWQEEPQAIKFQIDGILK